MFKRRYNVFVLESRSWGGFLLRKLFGKVIINERKLLKSLGMFGCWNIVPFGF